MEGLYPELQELILIGSDLYAVQLALSNRALQKILQKPSVYNQIGRKNGLILDQPFSSYEEFVDTVNAKTIVRGCTNYFSPMTCLQRALKAGDVTYADRLFHDLKVHISSFRKYLTDYLDIEKMIRSAVRSSTSHSLDWIIKNLAPFQRHHDPGQLVEMLILDATVENFKMVFSSGLFDLLIPNQGAQTIRHFMDFRFIAVRSNHLEMLEYIFLTPPDDLLLYDRTLLRAISPTQWERLYQEAYELDNENSLDFLDSLEGSPKLQIDQFVTSKEFFDGIPLNLIYYKSPQAVDKILDASKFSGYHTIFYESLSYKNDALEILSVFLPIASSDERFIPLTLGEIPKIIVRGDLYIANYLASYLKFDEETLRDEFTANFLNQGEIPEPIVLKWFKTHGGGDPIYDMTLEKYLSKLIELQAIYSRDEFVEEKFYEEKFYEDNLRIYMLSYHINPSEHGNSALIKNLQNVEVINDTDGTPSSVQIQQITKRVWLPISKYVDLLKIVVDHPQFDPSINYDELMKAVSLGASSFNFKLDLELFGDDPRVDTRKRDLRNPRVGAPNRDPRILIHLKKLSNEARYQELIKVDPSLNDDQFHDYYVTSNQELAELLNAESIPFVPHFNHLAAAMYLRWKDIDQLERIAPVSSLNWLRGENS